MFSFHQKRRSLQSGFTLIELLVVIAIIGILASVVLASLNSARGKSRNAALLAQLKEVQTSLERYYIDNGAYPNVGDWVCIGSYDDNECWNNGGQNYAPDTNFNAALAPYIDLAAINLHQGTHEGIMYQDMGTGQQDYDLIYVLEGDVDCPVGVSRDAYSWAGSGTRTCTYSKF